MCYNVFRMEYTEQQLKDLRADYAKGATDSQFNNFILHCQERKLVPGRHVYFQLRKAREWSEEARAYEFVKKASYQTSIDAFRLIAQRSGEYRGQDAPVYIYADEDGGGDFIESSIQKNDPSDHSKPLPPWAVRVGVYRKGFEKPIQVTARFEAYAVYVKDGNSWVLNNMWERRGPEQLEKCAEALALRKAFPEELGGIYLAEELPDDPDEAAPQTIQVAAPAAQPSVPATPEVNHTPAEGKEEPRPDKTKRREKSAKADISESQRTKTSTHERQSSDTTGAAPAEPETPAQGENPAPTPTPPPEPVQPALTKEERSKFIERLKTYARTSLPNAGVQDGSEALQNYIMGFFGKPARELGREQFEELLANLDTAAAAGDAELVKLVKGEYKQ